MDYEQVKRISNESAAFCRHFEPKLHRYLKQTSQIKRIRASHLKLHENMALKILFSYCKYKDFKSYYLNYVLKEFNDIFPLVSYSQFTRLTNKNTYAFQWFLDSRKKKLADSS